MRRSTRFAAPTAAVAFTILTAAVAATASAQPPEPPPGPPEGPPPPEFRDPLRGALDANHDFELDADEIAKAPEALTKLDKDGDGTISRDEFRPPMGPPPGRPGRGPGDRGFERPRRPEDGDSGDGPPPPRDRESPEGPPRPREGRPGAGDRPSPERFLERAKSFDTDGDGKLDEGELQKLAEAMTERMRARGPGGPGGPPRGDGERPERPRRPE